MRPRDSIPPPPACAVRMGCAGCIGPHSCMRSAHVCAPRMEIRSACASRIGRAEHHRLNYIHTIIHMILRRCSGVCINILMNSREIIKAIEADGWVLRRITGSHHHFRHPTKPGTVTVPHPKRDIHPKTLRSVEKQAGVKLT
ncbi:type II toxin-antitoxin system HicA family toxin [Gluconacetobacter sp. Hr-1-5]|uniref:type II toxin-antitoxin system HicA family toxin n=1 Tax=Gluconacetobacter sp. Hr-1-5 TaxID=3395370 RepID=UPI003B51F7A9